MIISSPTLHSLLEKFWGSFVLAYGKIFEDEELGPFSHTSKGKGLDFPVRISLYQILEAFKNLGRERKKLTNLGWIKGNVEWRRSKQKGTRERDPSCLKNDIP